MADPNQITTDEIEDAINRKPCLPTKISNIFKGKSERVIISAPDKRKSTTDLNYSSKRMRPINTPTPRASIDPEQTTATSSVMTKSTKNVNNNLK